MSSFMRGCRWKYAGTVVSAHSCVPRGPQSLIVPHQRASRLKHTQSSIQGPAVIDGASALKWATRIGRSRPDAPFVMVIAPR